MYSIYEELLRKRGVTSYQIAKDLGFSPATLSDWKHGRTIPKADKMQMIADYLGVTLEYLMTGKEPEEKGAEDFALLKKIHSLNSTNYALLLSMIDTMLSNQ